MKMTRIRNRSAALVLLATCWPALAPRPLPAGAPVPGAPDACPLDEAGVERRVRDWELTPEERRFDEIGWARGIREAERLAREHGRPVFLFTHDGRMNIGRC